MPGYTPEVNVPDASKALEEAMKLMAAQRAEDQKHIALLMAKVDGLTAQVTKADSYFGRTSPKHSKTRKRVGDNAKRLDELENRNPSSL